MIRKLSFLISYLPCDYKILVLILSWSDFMKKKLSLKLVQFKYSMGFPNIFKILWRRNCHWNLIGLNIQWVFLILWWFYEEEIVIETFPV